ncbi:MAG TPA: SelB C-terminal domain-containing protein, partial [Methylomirabilota bacterium]|nr:SelB C-terminal domain-containing protein [Methylomirabilota bacterium]
FGPARLRALLDGLQAAGRVVAIDRDWYVHPESLARLRDLTVAALGQFHRAFPLRPGMSREELRGRAGAPDERVFAHLLAGLDAEGVVRTDRDKVRLASHDVRLSPAQRETVDRLEQDFLGAAAAPPSPEEALARAGLSGDEDHELFQLLVEARKLVRVKESLYFHAEALAAIQDKLVAMLRERKEIGPGDIKDLLGISRKYAIPLLEFFDARRVTARVGERRVLRGG